MIRKRNIIITLSIFLVIGLFSLFTFVLLQNNQTPPTETIPVVKEGDASTGNNQNNDQPTPQASVKLNDTELIDTITKQSPSLLDANQQPIFGIVKSIKTASNWYVVTIIDKVDPTVGTAKIIMKDSGAAGVVIVAGPGTKFSRDSFTFPEDVWKLL